MCSTTVLAAEEEGQPSARCPGVIVSQRHISACQAENRRVGTVPRTPVASHRGSGRWRDQRSRSGPAPRTPGRFAPSGTRYWDPPSAAPRGSPSHLMAGHTGRRIARRTAHRVKDSSNIQVGTIAVAACGGKPRSKQTLQVQSTTLEQRVVQRKRLRGMLMCNCGDSGTTQPHGAATKGCDWGMDMSAQPHMDQW